MVRSLTKLLTESEVEAFVMSQQVQIDRDFGPIWNTFADIKMAKTDEDITKYAWQVLLLDNTDQANDLGYHDENGSNGEPRAKVFVQTTLDYGLQWTVTASHEILEMLVDPKITNTVIYGQFQYALEVCDPCEDDKFAYEIAGLNMSAFVTPQWFAQKSGTQFSFPQINEIKMPFDLAPGGFISRRKWNWNSAHSESWEQYMADEIGPRALNKGPSSRTKRRK